jgi:hypothetical protein
LVREEALRLLRASGAILPQRDLTQVELRARVAGVQPRGERRGAGPEPQFPCPAQVRRLIDVAAEAGQAGPGQLGCPGRPVRSI